MNLPAKPAIANRNCNARHRATGKSYESQIVEFAKKRRREKFRAGW
jgi:hypothetical protein